MRRRLRMMAPILSLLCCASAAQAETDAAPRMAPEAVCETGTVELLILTEAEKVQCQRLWRDQIAEKQKLSRDLAQRIREENRQRQEQAASLPRPPPPPVTVETFLSSGDVAYGDVVVTDRGPRVFVGRPNEAAGPEDFVTLDSPRSPHRTNSSPYAGAFPELRTTRPAAPQRAHQRQERRP